MIGIAFDSVFAGICLGNAICSVVLFNYCVNNLEEEDNAKFIFRVVGAFGLVLFNLIVNLIHYLR